MRSTIINYKVICCFNKTLPASRCQNALREHLTLRVPQKTEILR
jgi:hypothetical protein